MRRSFSLAFSLMLLCAPALGDEIHLKNGSVLHGRIVREDQDSLVIDLGRGRMNIARRDIVTIRRSKAPAPGDGESETRPPVRPDDRTRRGTDAPAQHAIPPAEANPRVPIVPAQRKKKDRPAPTPKVVPVDRTPPKPPARDVGPEASGPARKEATHSGPSATKPGARRTATADW
jgi:hypothetical protein